MHDNDNRIRTNTVNKTILLANIILTGVYMSWWIHTDHIGNPYMYWALFAGEVYHVIMAFLFWHTIWPSRQQHQPGLLRSAPHVDVFIPVAGEPASIVRKTVTAARDMLYPRHSVYILNDGYVAGNPDWESMEQLAEELDVQCITRRKKGGAKAGNINNALRLTRSEYIAVFDADMVPDPQFLRRTMAYFENARVGFVQTPQYYANHTLNRVTSAAWQQQSFFYGPIMQGKDRVSAAFICGTNFVARRRAIQEVGGMREDNIAEDFITSLSIHRKGWNSVYVPQILASGLAPEDMTSYYNQQLRWARGSLEVFFTQNPLLSGGLTLGQRLQYLASTMYYLNGFVVLIDIIMPVLFLLFGLQAVTTTTTSFALYFIPFMLMSLYTLHIASGTDLTFRAMAFSQASCFLQLKALLSILAGRRMSFKVTPKQGIGGRHTHLAYPHIAYCALVLASAGVALYREGLNPAVTTNLAWGLFNIIMFMPYIAAAVSFEGRTVPLPAARPATT